MRRHLQVYRMAVAAMLVAVGILIPMVMPIKVYIPPMSFTLASHVAIFLAMFISPGMAAVVSLGTTLGFVLSGLPLDVWVRALTHLVWAVGGALWLRRFPETLTKPVSAVLFCLAVAVIHAGLEWLSVMLLFFGGTVSSMSQAIGDKGYLYTFLLVFGGSTVHSCVDFVLAQLVWLPLRKVRGIAQLTQVR